MEQTETPKNLWRSSSDRVLAGVAGGLARYLGVDPIWTRLGFGLSSFILGLGILVYGLLWITLPEEPTGDEEDPRPPLATRDPKAVLGVVFLTLGVLLLMKGVLDVLTWKLVLPALFIVLGLFLLNRRSSTS